jgi:hypothetical protein
MDLTASSYVTSSVLTLVMPLALLAAICIYWAVVLKRRSDS